MCLLKEEERMSSLTNGRVEVNEAHIDAIFTELDRSSLPGVTVGIAVGGRPVYRKGFGRASLELPVVLTPTTGMRLGSISKQFTSLAYMLLVEDGLAGLDDRLETHLPEVQPIARGVTLRQLMGNISGLMDAHDVCFQFSGLGEHVTSDDLVKHMCDIEIVNAPPGAVWLYNNSGFELIKAVIERVSGQTLREVMQERIFDPLGMRQTDLRAVTYYDFLPNRAQAHMINSKGDWETWSWTEFVGAGGVVSSVDDMLRWAANFTEHRVGTAQTWEVMTTSQTLTSGSPSGYGLGLFVEDYRGVRTLQHSGGGMGSNAHLLKVPSAELDIVLMSNREDVSAARYAYKVLDAVLEAELEPRPTDPAPAPVTGTFRSATTGCVIRLSPVEQGSSGEPARQHATFGTSAGAVVMPDATGVLRPASFGDTPQDSWGLALRGDPGKPDGLSLDEFGTVDELDLVGPSTDDGRKIAGRYESAGTGSELTIEIIDGRVMVRTIGRFGASSYELTAIGEDVWQADIDAPGTLPRLGDFGSLVSFSPDGSEFRWFTKQSLGIPFHRVDAVA
jgi:D-aminopeptidase